MRIVINGTLRKLLAGSEYFSGVNSMRNELNDDGIRVVIGEQCYYSCKINVTDVLEICVNILLIAFYHVKLFLTNHVVKSF